MHHLRIDVADSDALPGVNRKGDGCAIDTVITLHTHTHTHTLSHSHTPTRQRF